MHSLCELQNRIFVLFIFSGLSFHSDHSLYYITFIILLWCHLFTVWLDVRLLHYISCYMRVWLPDCVKYYVNSGKCH